MVLLVYVFCITNANVSYVVWFLVVINIEQYRKSVACVRKMHRDTKWIQQRGTIIFSKICTCETELQNVMTCILGMHFYSSNYRVSPKYNRRDVSMPAAAASKTTREIVVHLHLINTEQFRYSKDDNVTVQCRHLTHDQRDCRSKISWIRELQKGSPTDLHTDRL